uniref:Uncharacterized protein n=1 Tax=Caenorhabditis japonica TaxID=281687 RepID=A0A8R1IT61_CAEJA
MSFSNRNVDVDDRLRSFAGADSNRPSVTTNCICMPIVWWIILLSFAYLILILILTVFYNVFMILELFPIAMAMLIVLCPAAFDVLFFYIFNIVYWAFNDAGSLYLVAGVTLDDGLLVIISLSGALVISIMFTVVFIILAMPKCASDKK